MKVRGLRTVVKESEIGLSRTLNPLFCLPSGRSTEVLWNNHYGHKIECLVKNKLGLKEGLLRVRIPETIQVVEIIDFETSPA